jgi:hypothetical protein
VEWMQAACEQIEEEVVAIDGKTLCGSYDSHSNKAALHMVSARGRVRITWPSDRSKPKRNPTRSPPFRSSWRPWKCQVAS